MSAQPAGHVDVLIIGAGLSGICAAHYLHTECPGRSYAILEARGRLGGTWDLFRYPGIRSDSDMFTLGYSFRPWPSAQSIADGPDILRYLRDTAASFGADRKIQYGLRVERANWSSRDGRWTVYVREAETGELLTRTCNFLWACTGYYRYDQGYTPEFPGSERFQGRMVHPQLWTEDIDYEGKRVVVVGSGATAMTLVPAMSASAGHVTMLQRSPTFVIALPRTDPRIEWLQQNLPARMAHAAARWRHIMYGVMTYGVSRTWPEKARAFMVEAARGALSDDFDVDTHFNPSYAPWDQRVCVIPDGDLFDAINRGEVSVVTDHIETFTETGIQLRSGEHLDADLIVTATGLELQMLGGATVEVDGKEIDGAGRMLYKGAMLSDIPNAAICLGYVNASWTLKCELTCEYICRLLNHMEQQGWTRCCPRDRDPSVTRSPVIELSAGYVQRAAATLPRQGSRAPWRVPQNYLEDRKMLRGSPVVDGVMEFAR